MGRAPQQGRSAFFQERALATQDQEKAVGDRGTVYRPEPLHSLPGPALPADFVLNDLFLGIQNFNLLGKKILCETGESAI